MSPSEANGGAAVPEPGPAPGAIGLPLDQSVHLPQFLANRTALTPAARRLIVEQAIGILQHVYAHLPVKEKLYDIDPIQRLRELLGSLGAGDPADDLPFQRDLVAILSTCRDMHTGYCLPPPFTRAVAFLPFQIEAFDDHGAWRYLVPRVLLDDPAIAPEIAGAPDFQRGVEIVAWDGVPIHDAVMREGDASPGINDAARHARGVCRLTTRLLAKCPPPDRDTVNVTYRDNSGTERSLEATWRVATLPDTLAVLPEGAPIDDEMHPLDFETEVFRALKSELARRHLAAGVLASSQAAPLDTSLPSVLEASARKGPDGTAYAYVRIRSFVVNDPEQARSEFVRLVGALPQEGLVIDVRDNPGGAIQAAEMILQALASTRLDRAPLVFRTTPFLLRLCQQRPATYQQWTNSILRAQRTGMIYSAGVPLWPDSPGDAAKACYPGHVVLITSALSYSATDFFAAGFQDHAIGSVLGVHETTGGGGANMWTLQGLVAQIGNDRDRFADIWIPEPLPQGADIHTAFRRSLRTGPNTGLEVEDFAVTPDAVHAMTRADLMDGNPDLFAAAVALLEARRAAST